MGKYPNPATNEPNQNRDFANKQTEPEAENKRNAHEQEPKRIEPYPVKNRTEPRIQENLG